MGEKVWGDSRGNAEGKGGGAEKVERSSNSKGGMLYAGKGILSTKRDPGGEAIER